MAGIHEISTYHFGTRGVIYSVVEYIANEVVTFSGFYFRVRLMNDVYARNEIINRVLSNPTGVVREVEYRRAPSERLTSSLPFS